MTAGEKEYYNHTKNINNLGEPSYKELLKIHRQSLEAMNNEELNKVYELNERINNKDLKQVDLESGVVWETEKMVCANNSINYLS